MRFGRRRRPSVLAQLAPLGAALVGGTAAAALTLLFLPPQRRIAPIPPDREPGRVRPPRLEDEEDMHDAPASAPPSAVRRRTAAGGVSAARGSSDRKETRGGGRKGSDRPGR